MRTYDPRRPLISIHVPKCAGSSLREVLKAWYPGRFYRHYINEKTGERPPRRDLRAGFWQRVVRRQSYQPGLLIHGHFNANRGTGIQDYYPYVDQFITVLRDPFEIAVSDYFYLKARADHWLINGHVRPIAEHYANFADFFEREVLRRQAYITNHMPVPLTLANYADALHRRFVYIGIAEDLSTSVRRLAERLGFPVIEPAVLNESPRDEAIEPSLRETFVRSHPLEYALYEFALAHYQD